MVAELGQGRLHAQLMSYLAPEPFVPIFGTPSVTPAIAPSGGDAWHVQYVRAVAIRVPTDEARVMVELLSLDEQLLFERPMLLQRAKRLVDDLNSSIGGSLKNSVVRLLELPTLSYQVTWNSDKTWWEARFSGAVTFLLPLEHLSILALTYQNSSLRKDLLAYPENRNPKAYDQLAQASASFPWSLPFSLWLEESRAFLEHLGVSRRRLMELSKPHLRWTDTDIVLEVLGLSQQEADLIAPASPHAKGWKFWGLQESDNQVFDHASGEPRSGTWLELLGHVSMLLQQSGLSYRELLNLLQTSYVKAVTPPLTIEPAFACQPSKMTFKDLNTSHLDRIHRFVRLWRRLGWTMSDLDRIISTFGSGTSSDITPATLIVLSLMQRLHHQLKLPIQVLASWFAGLDTRKIVEHTQEGTPELPSLYATIFLRPALHVPPDTDFELNDAGTELRYLSQTGAVRKKLSSKATLVGAALGIKASEVVLLVDPASGLSIVDELSLANLSAVFRVASLARTLGLSIEHYLRLKAVIGRDPFNPTTSGLTIEQRIIAVLAFVDDVECIHQSGFSLEEMEYILRHKTRVGTPFALLEQEHAQFLAELRLALQSGAVLGEINADNLRRQLQRLNWYPELIKSVVGWYPEVSEPVIRPPELAYYPQVAVQIAKLPTAPRIPDEIRDIFSYRELSTSPGNAELGCNGLATDQAFTRLESVIPSNLVSRLKTAYEQQMQERATELYKQMQSFTLPIFREKANLPSPVP